MNPSLYRLILMEKPQIFQGNGPWVTYEWTVCEILIFDRSRIKKMKTRNICNPLLNEPWFLGVCCTNPLKTLWEKEKLLITSNFFFSHSVFYPFGEFSLISKLLSANSFSLEESKICHLGKGLKKWKQEISFTLYQTTKFGTYRLQINPLLHRYSFWRINNR